MGLVLASKEWCYSCSVPCTVPTLVSLGCPARLAAGKKVRSMSLDREGRSEKQHWQPDSQITSAPPANSVDIGVCFEGCLGIPRTHARCKAGGSGLIPASPIVLAQFYLKGSILRYESDTWLESWLQRWLAVGPRTSLLNLVNLHAISVEAAPQRHSLHGYHEIDSLLYYVRISLP